MPQQEGINRLKLSQLRPRMPRAALEDAFGSKWKEPPSKNLGWVWGKDYGAHFNARLTTENLIGEVSFPGTFPAKYEIDGLRTDMTPEAALAAQPDLRLESEDTVLQDRTYVAELSTGVQLRIKFRKDRVGYINLSDPAARYYDAATRPLPPPERYPAPQDPPGFPFADVNLKLCVLGGLALDKLIDLGEPEDVVAHVLRGYQDLESIGDEPIPEVRDYLSRYPLSDELLAQVTKIGSDPASDVYRCIHYFWGGSTEEFDIQDLTGIGHCKNLKGLYLELMRSDTLDLAPLREAPSLEEVSVDLRRGRFKNLAVLLELPRLSRVFGEERADNDQALIAALKLKGVAVQLAGR